MDTTTIAANALVSSVTLLLICYLAFWRYRTYQVDAFREDMFILRDTLFDEASEGLIDFNHPAYGILRRTMNGFIRFGHRLSLWQVICLFLLVNKQDLDQEETDRDWHHITRDLDEPTKKRLREYKQEMEKMVIKHLVFSFPESVIILPILIVSLLLLLAMALLRRKTVRSAQRAAWRKIESNFDEVGSAALVYGS